MADKQYYGDKWASQWNIGGRSRQGDSDTDSEHRRLREERNPNNHNNTAEATSSDDDLESRFSAATITDPRPDKMASETEAEQSSPKSMDPDMNLSEDEGSKGKGKGKEVATLVRNGYNDSTNDYLALFAKLQIDKGFYDVFFNYIKEHREGDEVKAALTSGTEKGVEDVARDFLEKYGDKVWKLKGKNCKQDKKRFGKVLFDIKTDSDKLLPILGELWFKVRYNNFCFAQPVAESEDEAANELPVAATSNERSNWKDVVPRYPAPFVTPAPGPVDLTEEEEEIALGFLNKVREEVYGLDKPLTGRKR